MRVKVVKSHANVPKGTVVEIIESKKLNKYYFGIYVHPKTQELLPIKVRKDYVKVL